MQSGVIFKQESLMDLSKTYKREEICCLQNAKRPNKILGY